jgi:cell division protease FtsH
MANVRRSSLQRKNVSLAVYFKLYWLRILLSFIAAFLIISFVCIIVVGLRSFIAMEPFYKRMTMSGLAFQLYMSIYTAIFFASIYTFAFSIRTQGGFGKLTGGKIKPEDVNVHWEDVIGMEDIKKEVAEVIRLIKDRTYLQKMGGKIIKGVLMIGPPGCGKTYLAKAIATETGLPFLYGASSEFIGMYVGQGAQKMRSLFKEARKLAQLYGGCIVFIDEIDTIARPRVTPSGLGGGMSYNATVNQLLTDLDGLDTKSSNITVFGATNISEDNFDPALMRAGRFDRKIYVGYPSLIDRKKIIQYYLQDVTYNKTKVDVDKFARMTVGLSPADISNIIREAALISIRKKKTAIDGSDLHEAQERLTIGIKSQIVLSKKDKHVTAYHEAGHVVVTYLAVPHSDVFKATIIPRRGTGGATWTLAKEENNIPDKKYLLATIRMGLAGFIAEKIKYGVTSMGVASDFNRATSIAYSMVWSYGMGKSGYVGDFKGTFFEKNHYVPRFAHELDQDANEIINQCLQETEDLLRKNWDVLTAIAEELIKKEELDYDAICLIFNAHNKKPLKDSEL